MYYVFKCSTDLSFQRIYVCLSVCPGNSLNISFSPVLVDLEGPQPEGAEWTDGRLGWQQWLWEKHHCPAAAEALRPHRRRGEWAGSQQQSALCTILTPWFWGVKTTHSVSGQYRRSGHQDHQCEVSAGNHRCGEPGACVVCHHDRWKHSLWPRKRHHEWDWEGCQGSQCLWLYHETAQCEL